MNTVAVASLYWNDSVNWTEVYSTGASCSDLEDSVANTSNNANSVPSVSDGTEGDDNISVPLFYDAQDTSSEWSTEEEFDEFDSRQ